MEKALLVTLRLKRENNPWSPAERQAELAELTEYRTRRIRPDLSPREILMSSLGGIESEWVPLGRSRIASVLAEAEQFLEMLNDPGDSYAVCELCLGPSGLIR